MSAEEALVVNVKSVEMNASMNRKNVMLSLSKRNGQKYFDKFRMTNFLCLC